MILTLLQSPVTASDITAGGIVAAVLAGFKVWDHFKGKQRDSDRKSNVVQQNTELRAIRDTMTVRFDNLDERVTDLKKDLGRELGEVKDRVDGLEVRERDRLERAAVTLDRRTGA